MKRPVRLARCVLVAVFVGSGAVSSAQPGGRFTSTGNMIAARSQHSATLLPDGRVLIAGGGLGNSATLTSVEVFDPDTGTFRAAGSMTAARRTHTATLLPDDKVLIVGGYGAGGVLASAELFEPATGTFTPTGSLNAARAGHTAILLSTGKVLIVGGYGRDGYPNVASAELYDPETGAFEPAGAYVGRGGCDFCAPSVVLFDGTVLFPGQYPAQLYEPTRDAFSALGMMLYDQSTAAALMNGRVLFAGGEPIGRIADAELYDPATRTFVSTGSMASRRVWHSLTLLPNGMVLAAGGETESCSGSGCWFAGSLATAELYDPAAGAFVETGSMTSARETHTATVLKNGTVLVAGGVSYGGIGMFNGSFASAELYVPDVQVAAAALVSISGDGRGQGAIFHAGTRNLVTADDPASAGESVDIFCTGLPAGGVIRPQVAIGGRMAPVLAIDAVPGSAGVMQVRVRVPTGVARGSAVRVRLTYLDRPSNEVTMGMR